MRTIIYFLILLLFNLTFVPLSFAAPYQQDVYLSYSKLDSHIQLTSVRARHHLRAVDSTDGPLAQRAFTDQAAYVGIGYLQQDSDRQSDSKLTSLTGHFVTQRNWIFDVTYQRRDNDTFRDTTAKVIGIGKYLDGRTFATLSYKTETGLVNEESLTARYKRLVDAYTRGTYMVFDLSFEYIDTPTDSGYRIAGDGIYYLSDSLSIGLNTFRNDTSVDVRNTFSLRGEYFFSETLFAGLRFTTSNASERSNYSGVGAFVGMRF